MVQGVYCLHTFVVTALSLRSVVSRSLFRFLTLCNFLSSLSYLITKRSINYFKSWYSFAPLVKTTIQNIFLSVLLYSLA